MQDLAYDLTRRFADQLGNLDRWFDKAAAHAQARKFDANTLLQARLAPDMFPLGRQVGIACDNAKAAAARLSGKTAPVHADDLTTVEQYRARIADVRAFIDSTTREDFANAHQVKVSFPWYPGKALAAEAYLMQYAVPNFHFHYTTVYAILRHNGVDLGKGDYLGSLPWEQV